MIRFRSPATWVSVAALALLSACGGDNPSESPAPPPSATNSPPTASAGPDRVVAPGAAVTLDGSASSDANGTITTYAWTQTSGATVTLTAANTASPGFTAPSASGALVFQLTVTDNGGASRSDTVTVTVNASPVAQAGADQTVQTGAAVSLSGSGTDADGTITSFAWKQTAGQSVTLSAPNTATTTFTAPAVAASFTFELTVTDNLGATHSDSVVVTVSAASAPKIVRQPVSPNAVHHGSALFFVVASGEDLTYEWRGPFGFVKSSPEPFLMRTGLDPSDDGHCYYVVISNAAGSVTSEEACVTVGDIGDFVLDPFDDNLGDDESVARGYANTLLWLAEQVSGGFTVPSFAALTGTPGILSGVPRAVEAGESCLQSGSFDGSTFDDSVVTTGAFLPTGRHTITFAWSDCRTTSDDVFAEDGGVRIDYDFPVRFGEGSATYYFSGYQDARGRGPLNGVVHVTSAVQGSPGNGLQDNIEIELGDELSHGAWVVRLDPRISVERRYNDTGSFANRASVAFDVPMQTYDAGGSVGLVYERSESAGSFLLRFDEGGGGGESESSPFTSVGVMSVALDSVQTFHLADLELAHDSEWRFTVIPQEECPADTCAEPP
jgi:K319-like protein